MKKVILTICFFSCYWIVAQPIDTPPVSIKKMYFEEKQIYFEQIHSQLYNSVSKAQKEFIDRKNKYITSLCISVNSNTFFIKNKDTMQVKLVFNEYYPIAPVFFKMHFIKGTFIIDMNECVKEKGFIIKNFPCDCLAYRKEEVEKQERFKR